MKEEIFDQGYKKLKIYIIAHELAVKVHKMTMKLPKHEIFEEGGQIRRSSKSVASNIVEGYALRRYKQEYIHYLSRSLASSMETLEHLDLLQETGSLSDQEVYKELYKGYTDLNGMLYSFIQSVEEHHDPNKVGKIPKRG
jgi:four helix bundle protein